MDEAQEKEWIEAQKIVISEDLVAAAKRQLQFLAAVDRNRWLYEGPTLKRAIYRYTTCWLPFLARYSESQASGSLVVPLDCEWIWHCHRLNPVRYKADCEEFYGQILDNSNVVSSVQGVSSTETEQIWNKMFPEEPYDFDATRTLSSDESEEVYEAEKHTKYNLVLAVERQIPFFYQVSRPHMNNDLFLDGAVARYKGFLHMIKSNRERSIRRFCVPTYDIDLMWHTHQLHSAAYCNDLINLIGKVLEHDDTDQDRGKGKKLDVGFAETTKQWEDTFGSRYWRAGAMYRGSAPSPLTTIPFTSNILAKDVVSANSSLKLYDLPDAKIVEVLLEFVDVKNLPEEHKGKVYVLLSKTQPDKIFTAKRRLNILSESGEKQIAIFHSQPAGYLYFELALHSPSGWQKSMQNQILGSSCISLEEYLSPVSTLSVEKWLEVVPSHGFIISKPIFLRVAVSFTIPVPAPRVFQMVRSRPFSKGSSFFSFCGKMQFAKSWTRITDETGDEVISLQMRGLKKIEGFERNAVRKEVIAIARFGGTHTLAQLLGTEWSLIDSQWSFNLQKDLGLLELTGHRMVKLVRGRKLQYETKEHEEDKDFVTFAEFSAEYPYGKAVALLDPKGGLFLVQEDWFVLPGITLAFIISCARRKVGFLDGTK